MKRHLKSHPSEFEKFELAEKDYSQLLLYFHIQLFRMFRVRIGEMFKFKQTRNSWHYAPTFSSLGPSGPGFCLSFLRHTHTQTESFNLNIDITNCFTTSDKSVFSPDRRISNPHTTTAKMCHLPCLLLLTSNQLKFNLPKF